MLDEEGETEREMMKGKRKFKRKKKGMMQRDLATVIF